MIIKNEDNATIIKQLTELFDKSFEDSLDETMQKNNSVRTIKNGNKQEASLTEVRILTSFIKDWIGKMAYDPLYCRYVPLMRYDCYSELYRILYKQPDNWKLVDQELLIRIKQHNGSIKESLLAVVKPLLVENFVLELINSLETALELLSLMNHYNDYNYQLQRFISVFEENLLRTETEWNKHPLELLNVWWLDKTFLKETIIPELNKRTLTDEQKNKAAIHKSCINLVNNYYDYCLYYAFSGERVSDREELFETTFFYEKDDFVKAVSIIKNAVDFYEQTEEEDAEWGYDDWLEQTEENKPEWLDALRSLLGSYDDEDDDEDEWDFESWFESMDETNTKSFDSLRSLLKSS